MNGSQILVRNTQSPAPNKTLITLWTLLALVAVVAAGVAIRLVGGRQAIAQAPSGKAATQAIPARPGGALTQGNLTTIPPRAGTASPSAAAQPKQPTGQVAARPAPAGAAPPPQVLAVVNGEQITRTDLGRECIRRYGKEVLESMTNRQLIADECAKKNIKITEADISSEIDKVANRFGLSRDRWLQLLRDERGFSEEQYRREVLWPMLALRQVAAGQAEVSDADVKKAFESEFGPKVRARLIAVDKQQTAQQARAEAIADPNTFGELSKKYSADAGVASAYGVIPPIRKNMGDAHLEQVAFGLKPGQISEIVNVANMYYIIKCEGTLPPQYLTSQQITEQQDRIREKLKENKLRQSASDCFEQLQNKAKGQIEVFIGDPEKQKARPGVAATIYGKSILLAQLAEECITRHGAEVLDGEINRKILQQELNRKKQVVGSQDLDVEVGRAAESFGFVDNAGKPDKKRWLESVKEQPGATIDLYYADAVWPSVALKKLVGAKVEVTEEDLQKAYESSYGERVEALAIVVGDNRQAQKVWEMARNQPTDAFFAELAQQYSVEPSSKSNGGKVPPIPRHGGSPIVEAEAFKLKPGELSGIIAVNGQFIILRCQGRTRPVQVNMAEVKNELLKDIQEKKLRVQMTKEFDRLRETAQVDNFLARSSQSGARPTGPATLTPQTATPRVGATPPQRGAAAPPQTPYGPPRAGSGVSPASASAPRTSNAQAR